MKLTLKLVCLWIFEIVCIVAAVCLIAPMAAGILSGPPTIAGSVSLLAGFFLVPVCLAVLFVRWLLRRRQRNPQKAGAKEKSTAPPCFIPSDRMHKSFTHTNDTPPNGKAPTRTTPSQALVWEKDGEFSEKATVMIPATFQVFTVYGSGSRLLIHTPSGTTKDYKKTENAKQAAQGILDGFLNGETDL